MRKLAVVILLGLFIFSVGVLEVSAKGSSGGGRSSGGSRSVSSGSRSAPKASATTKSSATTASKPSASKVSTKPSSNTQTKTGTVKNTGGNRYSGKGYVVGSGYQPRFAGGYSAPVGSTVYYRQNSFLDYLPLYFLLTHDSHREAVVQHPDGKEEVVKEEGVDGMYIWNWIFTILVGVGLIAGIVYFINKLSKKKSYV